jgi:hypothetical protein
MVLFANDEVHIILKQACIEFVWIMDVFVPPEPLHIAARDSYYDLLFQVLRPGYSPADSCQIINASILRLDLSATRSDSMGLFAIRLHGTCHVFSHRLQPGAANRVDGGAA